MAFESIQDRQNIYFKNESLFVLDIKLTNEEMRSVTGRGEGLLSWLERFSFKKAIILASILIIAVIAHEIAHVQERHSLQQIIEVVGILAMASILFGGDEALIEEATVVAINLWSFKKSRNFEREADIVGLGLLETANISKNHFINAIEKLTNHYCQSASQDDIQNCLANSDSGWFSPHPSGAEKLEYLAND